MILHLLKLSVGCRTLCADGRDGAPAAGRLRQAHDSTRRTGARLKKGEGRRECIKRRGRRSARARKGAAKAGERAQGETGVEKEKRGHYGTSVAMIAVLEKSLLHMQQRQARSIGR